ncbi:MAG: protein-L-isoaspartate O-methyltransferase [Candidatus Korarchaeota archaeon]|nr:protein-L-isoaspartate O-methyltransferase [Thermoproteota archaeon]MCR8462804.1 protein-L-isoaspartate O-methyltransferase [Thermoproteota archaeon]MCR8470501.1 protein-L-isoaspartate O-methyltransferase [Thermoproteota archaeon]MCR8471860.1 protein-L-isoaspartate O-methyltransferase [Thermoproteota archaeon]MCR8472836.1 protein-L-isoaspartate O-methyltransferase [Thermoproteota archaeon]
MLGGTYIDSKLRKKLEEDKSTLYVLLKNSGIVNDIYLDAFMRVPREYFVLPEYVKYAYVDTPLPIIKDATISAISMCLLLCHYAELKQGKTVFEVGTGSGYQAALCAEVVTGGHKREMNPRPVCSMEIDPDIYEFGKSNLERLNYLKVVDVRLGDGSMGWVEKDRKFDAIIVTAAGKGIPEPLKYQLKIGGILVMPLEIGYDWQILVKMVRVGEKEFITRELEPVRFVPLKGKYGIPMSEI